MSFTGLYLDSNPLIYALESNDEALRDAFRHLFQRIIFFQLHTSELSLAELLVHPHQRDDQNLIERYKRLLQTSRNGVMMVKPITTSVLTTAASFRGRQIKFFGRKPSLLDSIHAATAYETGCSHFMTSDNRLKLWDQMKIVSATVSDIKSFLSDIS